MDPDVKKVLNKWQDQEKKTKLKSKDKNEPDVPKLSTYKSNELAMTVNEMLSNNIEPAAGKCLFGENLARSAEFYGLKAHPLLGLLVSAICLVLIIAKKIFWPKGWMNKKEKEETQSGGELRDNLFKAGQS